MGCAQELQYCLCRETVVVEVAPPVYREVDDGEECVAVHFLLRADLSDGLLAESESDAETPKTL